MNFLLRLFHRTFPATCIGGPLDGGDLELVRGTTDFTVAWPRIGERLGSEPVHRYVMRGPKYWDRRRVFRYAGAKITTDRYLTRSQS